MSLLIRDSNLLKRLRQRAQQERLSVEQLLEKWLESGLTQPQPIVAEEPLSYRPLFEHSNDAVFALDLNGNVIDLNQRVGEIFGYSRDELVALSYPGLVVPEQRDLCEAVFQQLIDGEHVPLFERTFQRKDGSLVQGEVNIAAVNDEQGNPRYILAVIRDITERKRVAQELEEQRLFIQNIFDTNPNVLYVHNIEHQQTVIINHRIPSAIGYSDQEVAEMGESILARLAHPDDLPRIADHFARLRDADDEEIFDLEYRMRHRDGSWRWFYSRDTPFKRTADGRVQEIIGTAVDITELRRAQEALRDSEARLSGVIASAMDAIITIDEAQQVILFNAAAEHMFGYSATEMIGHKLDRVIPHRFRAAHNAHIRHFGVTGITNRKMGHLDPLWGLRRDGHEFPIEASISQVNTGDRAIYTVILRDITARLRSENALRESEQRLRQFIRHSPAAIALLDTDMKYLSTSQRWTQDYRLGESDLTGRSHYEVFPETPQRLKETYQRCLKGATEKSDADPFLRADGTLDWVRWEIQPWHNNDGEIGGIIIFSEVITERMQAQKALLESEERYRAVVEDAPLLLTRFRQDGEIMFVNQAYCDFFKMTSDELIGKNFLDLLPEG